MVSSSLPSGAFFTSINGRRCTAIPRVAAAGTTTTTTSSTSSVAVVTTTSVASSTTTSTSSALQTSSTSSTSTTRSIGSFTTGLVAAPAADAETSTAVAEQSSTSTTSSSLLITTTSVPLSSVEVAQTQGSETSSSALPPVPPPVSTSSAILQSFTAFAALEDATPSQTSVAQSSQADGSVTAAGANAPASSSVPPAAETSAPLLPDGPAASPLLSTIQSPQTTTTGNVAVDATGVTPADSASNPAPAVSSSAVQSTVAVAGGVIGGVVAISILAFLIWWWRRRSLRKRRSTLLTPLDAGARYDPDEKGGYVISRGSIGPTPLTEKVRAALGQNLKRIRGHIRNRTAPSVNLDRGHSQFMDSTGTHSRANSGIIGAEPTVKDRVQDWWSGLKGAMGLSRRSERAGGTSSGRMQEKPRQYGSQPDFLTLLNMDDGELDREAQRRRARANGSISSTDHFLGSLKLDFGSAGDNPFSDANAIAHTSAKPAPLAVGGSSNNNNNNNNPFSDTNAIRDPKPTTYVTNIRRSRTNSAARPPSTYYYYNPTNRDSIGSLRSLATATTTNQRNKFRSDPFDLERPELLGGTPIPDLPPLLPSTSYTTTNPGGNTGATGGVRRPPGARTRAESFSSRLSKYSKYSSGVSAVSSLSAGGGSFDDGWSDPGPDVGPAATAREGGGKRVSGGSLGSLGSVGKAM